MNNSIPRWIVSRTLLPMLAGALALTSVYAGAAPSSPPTADRGYARVVLPAGTVIPVRLDAGLSSKDSQRGDKFSATVKPGNGDAGLPEGTRIDGVVREVERSQDGRPGMLDLDFTRMVTPGGQNRALAGSLISLNGKGVKPSDDGRLVATGDRGKDRLKFIGIGAGGGL